MAVTVVFVGVAGALMAARRPGGFIGVPLPPLQFLVIPLADLALFALFVTWAVFRRHDAQSHKRLMLLATIGLIDAAVARFPFVDMMVPVGMMWSRADLGVDLFLVAMITWDLISRRSIHPVTLIGAVVVIASQPLRMLLSETSAWMSFAAWAVRLPGS